MDGGADVLLVETVFDTLNAKAALYAIDRLCEARGQRIPVMVSGTLADYRLEAFAYEMSRAAAEVARASADAFTARNPPLRSHTPGCSPSV